VSEVESNDWAYLRDLPLVDPDFAATDKIDVLFGADVYTTIIGSGATRALEIRSRSSQVSTVSGCVDAAHNRGPPVYGCRDLDILGTEVLGARRSQVEHKTYNDIIMTSLKSHFGKITIISFDTFLAMFGNLFMLSR